MSKKKKRKEGREGGKTPGTDVPGASGADEADPISSTGKKTIVAGVVLAAAGFLVLSKADPMGRNWAATLSPFLILGGYALMGWGIFRDDPAAEASPASPGPEGGEPPAPAPPSVPSEKTT